MVLIEIIRINGDPIFAWRTRKLAEQLVRLIWVGFLVKNNSHLQGIRASLLFLYIFFVFHEILKGIVFYLANNSYLIGKNPYLMHYYVRRLMLQDDFRTTPMNSCDYIVMGEENFEIGVSSDGLILGEKKSNTEGMITIGRIFQLNSYEDEVFRTVHPHWHDNCISLALAKILRRRFSKLPVDEAGCRMALDFVLEGLIDYIGNEIFKTHYMEKEKQ
ncbi:hypothetical protein FCM35_KLT09678 [Carex littledalei]|uniref:Uncharacterized protein n=1 Tax=Carex littledalei TaxID=544730 RepID=A0A833RYT7_9POAL|nr:hypothetical protein FCM35_KLT09678 [Carex littledalei]